MLDLEAEQADETPPEELATPEDFLENGGAEVEHESCEDADDHDLHADNDINEASADASRMPC